MVVVVDQGAHVSWTPASAAHLVGAAYAQNHEPVAVVRRASGPDAAFRLVATRNGNVVATATARLGS